jgi:hypothetical protein
MNKTVRVGSLFVIVGLGANCSAGSRSDTGEVIPWSVPGADALGTEVAADGRASGAAVGAGSVAVDGPVDSPAPTPDPGCSSEDCGTAPVEQAWDAPDSDACGDAPIEDPVDTRRRDCPGLAPDVCRITVGCSVMCYCSLWAPKCLPQITACSCVPQELLACEYAASRAADRCRGSAIPASDRVCEDFATEPTCIAGCFDGFPTCAGPCPEQTCSDSIPAFEACRDSCRRQMETSID